MGTFLPKADVRISRASTLIGMLDGVDRVRGWMVRKSMCRSWSGPRTVVIKSIVFLTPMSRGPSAMGLILPKVFMHSDLDTDTPASGVVDVLFFVDTPAIATQMFPR